MRRLLILHCGPMKTGSTVIQDTFFLREAISSEARLVANN